jgi:acyl-CoA thioesterase-1
MTYFKVLLISLFLLVLSSCSKNIKIACVGDSITEGYGLSYQSKTSYPAVLDSLLGSGYSVLNLGRSATTLRKKGDFPYWSCKEFHNVFAYKPDIIIIQLGTNDTKTRNWDSAGFTRDYQALIDTFKTIIPKPKIYVCLPVPVFKSKWTINDSTLTKLIIPIIRNLAEKNNLPVMDLHSQMAGEGKYFFDGIHPDVNGAKIMAEVIAHDLKK